MFSKGIPLYGGIAQLARACGSYPQCPRFESRCRYQKDAAYRYSAASFFRPVGQVVKTPPFHGGNMGSSPVRVTKKERIRSGFSLFWCRASGADGSASLKRERVIPSPLALSPCRLSHRFGSRFSYFTKKGETILCSLNAHLTVWAILAYNGNTFLLIALSAIVCA